MIKIRKTVIERRNIYTYLNTETGEVKTSNEKLNDESGYIFIGSVEVGRDRVRYSMDVESFKRVAEREVLSREDFCNTDRANGATI